MKNYVVYTPGSGEIKWFWVAPPVPVAPDGMEVLEVGDSVSGNCVDTHRVVDGQLVLIE